MKLGRKERTATMTKGDEREDSPDLSGNGPATELDLDAPEVETAPRAAGGEPFGALLVRRGFVSEDDVAQALVVQKDSGKRLGETLVDMGALNERELILVLAELLHMPVVDLRRHNPDPELLSLIPEQVVRDSMAMPIRLDDDGLQVAVSEQPSVAV